ncbi:MAG: hypothetical protein PHE15_05170 [Dehalococcoidales bacterium]|jgi:hypothetical protein|nr:hypothetical protein [Dehalococcoidales bacterium]
MRNIKATLIIAGAIYIAEGIVLLVAPDRIASLYNFEVLTDSMSYLMAIIGSAFISAGVWFIMTVLDPLRNINAIRFAILWTSLLVIGPLYSLWQGYVEIGQVWFEMILNAVFAIALLIFYPKK